MSEKEELGTVCNVDGDKVSFHSVRDGPAIYLGEFVIIPSGERCFYARVYNRKSSTTVSKETQLREAEGKESVGPYSKYTEFDAVLFLEKCGDILRTPTLNPDYHDKIYRMTEEDYECLKLRNELQVGELRSGTKLFGEVGIRIESIPHMMGLFGKTGAGKSNCEIVLNAKIMENPKVVGLMFDMAGELLEGKALRPQRGLKDHPLSHKRLHYYSTRSEEHRLTIGLQSLYPSNLKYIFPDITVHQILLAERLYKEVGKNWVVEATRVYEDGDWKSVQKLDPGKGEASVIKALMRKLMSLRGPGWDVSNYSFIDGIISDLSYGISCLVDLSDLPEATQRSFTEFAGKRAAEFWKKMWEEKHEYWSTLPTLLITLEEAHQFLHKPDEDHPKSFFSAIALRFRKYRVGLLPVTPRPSLIDDDIFAEIHTKFVMKTTLKKDRHYITENTPYLEYSDTEIKLLGRGEALLISDPVISYAVPIKLTHYPDYLKRPRAPENQIVKHWET